MNPMILFIDIETTGLSVKSAHAVSIAWAIYRETGIKLAYNCFIVKPDGFRIPQGSINIHGITTDRALRDGESLKDVLKMLSSDIEKHNPYLLVAHNIAFDLPILKEECSRTGLGEIFSNMARFCTMESTTNLCKLPKRYGGYKWPKLNELHNYLFHRDITSAHDAGSDVLHCAKCFFELISRKHINLPEFQIPSARLEEKARRKADGEGAVQKLLSNKHHGFTNILQMKFVLIPSGTFIMGSPENEPERFYNETLHQVTISKPFYMQTTPVTQGQWQRVMGNNPSYFKGDDDLPVEQVSWNDVQDFIGMLNRQEGTGKYRLPMEAEWEYACRAGSTTAYCFGDHRSRLGEYAWYDDNSEDIPHFVGQKAPNAWGLYDMHGNVWEWCQNCYGEYPSDSVTDPFGPWGGSYLVYRGGSWGSDDGDCRSANRFYDVPGSRRDNLGFRLLRTVEQDRYEPNRRESPEAEQSKLKKRQLAMSKRQFAAKIRETSRDGYFIAYNNGTVLDTRTNLMWAGKDNEIDINWSDAESYCKNYRVGSYSDWRMPKLDELEELYERGNHENVIQITDWFVWASEKRDSEAAVFNFRNGGQYWFRQSRYYDRRALPVRSGK